MTSFAAAFRVTPESIFMHGGAIVFNGAFVDLMPAVFTGGTYILLPHVAAKYQRVQEVAIMEDFPRNVAGKTLKRVMRKPYWTNR